MLFGFHVSKTQRASSYQFEEKNLPARTNFPKGIRIWLRFVFEA